MSTQRCEWCDFRGEYPTEIVLSRKTDGDTVLQCADHDACEARWLAANPDDDMED